MKVNELRIRIARKDIPIPLTLRVCVVQPCTYYQFTINLLAALHIRIVSDQVLSYISNNY